MNLSKIIRGAHIFQEVDPFDVVATVEKFKVGKVNFEVVYSTTTFPVMQNGQQGFGVRASALVMWDCTQEEFESFRKRLALNLGKYVQQ